MNEKRFVDPLQGVTLEHMLMHLVARYGWVEMGRVVDIRCFNDNPSIKILALSFLVLIGVSLLGEGLGQHIDKGYIYFAMAFSFVIEIINMRLDKQRKH